MFFEIILVRNKWTFYLLFVLETLLWDEFWINKSVVSRALLATVCHLVNVGSSGNFDTVEKNLERNSTGANGSKALALFSLENEKI